MSNDPQLEAQDAEWRAAQRDSSRMNDRCLASVTDFAWCIKHKARWPVLKDKCEKA